MAYGKFYSLFNPITYKLFISLERLKQKGLLSDLPNEQKDICIYIDSKYMGHSGFFRDKSNKINYSSHEINMARSEYEKLMNK